MKAGRLSVLAVAGIVGLSIAGCSSEDVNTTSDASAGGGGTGGTILPDGGSEAASGAGGAGGVTADAQPDVPVTTDGGTADAAADAEIDATGEASVGTDGDVPDSAGDVAADAKPSSGNECHQVQIGGDEFEVWGFPPDAGTATPVAKGGTLTNGIYDLSDTSRYGAGVADGPLGEMFAETIEISGLNAAAGTFMLYDVTEDPTKIERSTLEASKVGGAASKTISAKVTCPLEDGGADAGATYTFGYTVVTGATFTQLIFIYDKGNGLIEAATFDKRK
jgi:hypothetical protein